MWKLPILEARATSGTTGTDLVLVFQDAGKKPISSLAKYAKLIERFRKGDTFTARCGAMQFIKFGGEGGTEDAFLVGLGPIAQLTEEKIRAAGGSAWSKLVAEKCESVAIDVDVLLKAKGLKKGLTPARLVRSLAEGLILPAYRFERYKTKKESTAKDSAASKEASDYFGPSRITFVTADKNLKKDLDAELFQAAAVGEAVTTARDWSNEPSNIGTPEYYANEAQSLARELGLKCKILTEKEALKERMGLFLGVSAGAERDGRIVVLEYNPKGVKNPKTVALVGKGVTFDSGGISIKPSMRMEEMKHDMTGAATVMGAILLAAQWQVPNRVVAIMAFTENMPDGRAIQPGNILVSRAGKTVEIINTDAEGRLILADALDYAQEFDPDVILDVATLTGAVTVALGKQCCAILGNNEDLIAQVRQAGEVNHERIWQLPLYDEYLDDMKSDTADLKNSVNDSYGGTIRGAIFLKQFVPKEIPWAHLDIAATAYNLSHLSYYPKKGASGAYVRTLAQFVADF